ncbi:hypothetical protein ACOSP7_026523 [Xanthoceras sorbifolium]
MGSVKETILLLHYERLLKHFFSYGMLGYLVQECPDDEIGVPRVSSECYPYGSWLRASSLVKMLASHSHRLEVLSGDVFNGTVLVKSEDPSRVHKSGSTSHGEGSLRESFVEALPNVGSDVLHGSVSTGVFPSSVFGGAQEGCIDSQLNGLEEDGDGEAKLKGRVGQSFETASPSVDSSDEGLTLGGGRWKRRTHGRMNIDRTLRFLL